VPELPRFGLRSSPLAGAVAEADLAALVTAHPGVDHLAVADAVETVDFRGILGRNVAEVRTPSVGVLWGRGPGNSSSLEEAA
jgi:UDP-N-acetyl-D-glucosamine dehydrogenase